MPAPAVVTIIAAVVVILVLAGFLLAIARVLIGLNRQLEAVMAAVGTISSQTEPVNSVVQSLNGNLATTRDVLSSLLESKVGADGAAQLVASVDPLAEPPAEEDAVISYRRTGGEEPDDAPLRSQPLVDPYPEPAAGRSTSGRGGGAIRLHDDRDELELEATPGADAPAPEAADPEAADPEAAEPDPAARTSPRGGGGGAIVLHDRRES